MKLSASLSHYFSKNVKGFPLSHAAGVIALGTALLIFSVPPPSNEAANTSQAEKLVPLKITNFTSLPADTSQTPTTQAHRFATTKGFNEPQNPYRIHTETVKNGDNLSFVFNRAGLADTALYAFMRSNNETQQLKQLHPGQKFTFKIDSSDELAGLKYQKNKLDSIEFIRNDTGFTAKSQSLVPDTYTAYREAVITDSLFIAGRKAGMEQSLIMEIANIFGWDVDFALDIRKNDSFKVLYEEQFLNGEKFKNGAILAAQFTNQGKTYRAVRYTDKNGVSNYFTPEGKSMRKAFLRTPVDFARISSHFNLKRKHPILNKIRAHKGTDYAAPTGTPIKAAGDGKVTFAGNKGGYGKTVIIQHGQRYKTLYAHMSKYGRGIRNGKTVKQGQIIGYVGTTGLSTGPHLHYEFHVNGAVRNPVNVPLPKAESIPKQQMATFLLQTQPLVAKLEEFTEQNQIIQIADASNASR